ncbi:thiamine pyrophosphate-binding protein [Magnetovibrio sp. PR-2]|uniref:thiamine pyrophosphate-dependent enzyme n=1 Tax=Magnetovibrio sp. PR-2 TaxID=3120356 RepID=UPI002FCE0C4E
MIETTPSSNPETANGGALIARALDAHGVEKVFCVPGESYLEVLDALYDRRDTLQMVSCRHENGASFMAEAYAKLTGSVGVCMVTRGPGACNGSIGVHTAFQDSSPMVYLVGHVRREDIGREAFQEVDFEQMFAPLAKAVRMIKSAKDAPGDVAWAFEQAQSGRPGPVVLVMPEDVLREEAGVTVLPVKPVSQPFMDEGDLERVHHRLMAAKRPMVMVGGSGWTAQGREDIVAFAEAMDLPVCCSMRRLDVFDNAHPCFVGEMGIAPNPLLVERINDCDLLLVVGARMGEMTSQGYTLLDAETAQHKLVHIHVDQAELGRVFPPAIGMGCGPAAFAAAAKNLAKTNDSWAGWRAQARADLDAWRRPHSIAGPLDLAQCMADLDEALDDDAIVTVDAGNFSGWAQRYLSFAKGRRFLGPTNGAMGYGVPSGVAAQTAFPDRQCVTFVGDGGFGMTGQEIATAVGQGLRQLILVFNNGIYGTIRMHQERRFPRRTIATDLHNPDFAELARAYGAYGDVVERTEQFLPAVKSALASGTVGVLDVRFDANIITTRTTLDAIRSAAEKQ